MLNNTIRNAAVRTYCNINKSINMLESIGLSVEGTKDNTTIGDSLYAALSDQTNIIMTQLDIPNNLSDTQKDTVVTTIDAELSVIPTNNLDDTRIESIIKNLEKDIWSICKFSD